MNGEISKEREEMTVKLVHVSTDKSFLKMVNICCANEENIKEMLKFLKENPKSNSGDIIEKAMDISI